jgi:hypothetical protein
MIDVFASCWNYRLRHEGAGNPSEIEGVCVGKILYRLFS